MLGSAGKVPKPSALAIRSAASARRKRIVIIGLTRLPKEPWEVPFFLVRGHLNISGTNFSDHPVSEFMLNLYVAMNYVLWSSFTTSKLWPATLIWMEMRIGPCAALARVA